MSPILDRLKRQLVVSSQAMNPRSPLRRPEILALLAEANLAAAVSAGISRSCPATFAALDSIQLLVPYLEKLVKDVAKRPEALGPRASRRGLEVAKLQLVNAGNKLYREIGIGCTRTSPPPKATEGAAPPATDPAPVPAPAN